ncbi:Fcf2 pre-rRNA processing-domain-containing protein [Scheffersomyces xylosifermentans]|uniref:Fcf2 pre-rRNA processing-domain-containing protein n=1 Tax=Scheffersomyces xylosifermentans TaxID=1304137 RepID=UPI00315C7ED9
MTPHKSTDSIIVETSETESFSSEQSKKNKQRTEESDVDVSLDDLFSELSKETKNLRSIDEEESVAAAGDNESEFKKIQQSISKLPKIQSSLEKNMAQQLEAQKKSKHDITRINDPIAVQHKKADTETKDSGSKWFNMKQPEMTPQIRRDLSVIQQRSALDPKRHYKKEKWSIPKYFQMGTIVEGNTEFYSARLSRKQRGSTLVEEILHDDDTKKYFKRKYSEIQDSKTSGKKGHYKNVKQMRRKF